MRIPELDELDRDQRNVYIKAKTDGSTLITGPPGTGKTILAIHRAHRLSMETQNVSVIMYNNVLAQYSGEGDSGAEIDTSKINITTMHKWLTDWHFRCFGRRPPSLAQFETDWAEIVSNVKSMTNEDQILKLDWGHLIVDEGQDFASGFYDMILRVQNKLRAEGKEGASVTVFADDNQSITKNRSTIIDIRINLNISVNSDRFWHVSKNYRNSLEIAKLTRCFQVQGAYSAMLPENKTGINPKVLIVKKGKGGLDQIKRIVTNRPIELGVVVLGSAKDVENIYGSLKNRLDGTNVLLQGYLNKPKKHEELKRYQNLKFDQRPSVTVLHKNSAKGLEFDVVYLMRCEALNSQADSELQTFRDLYVATSRARDELNLCFSLELESDLPDSIGFMPSPDREFCQFEADTAHAATFSIRLGAFKNWRESMENTRENVREVVSKELWPTVRNYSPDAVKKILFSLVKQQFHPIIENYDSTEEYLNYILVETYLFKKMNEIITNLK